MISFSLSFRQLFDHRAALFFDLLKVQGGFHLVGGQELVDHKIILNTVRGQFFDIVAEAHIAFIMSGAKRIEAQQLGGKDFCFLCLQALVQFLELLYGFLFESLESK